MQGQKLELYQKEISLRHDEVLSKVKYIFF
jgi:hypothetical protein